MLVNNPFVDAFGLDIGDLSIKLVQLTPAPFYQRNRYLLKEMRWVSLPPGLIVNGEIQQPEMIRKKLLILLGKEGTSFKLLRSPWVVANLPEPKTFLKLIDIETTDNDLTSVDVAYHAKKHLPFELETAYLDWQVVQRAPQQRMERVLMAAAQKLVADSYTYLLGSIGLNPIALEADAVAIARSMITEQKDYAGQGRAILDLGGTRSSLIVYDNNSIQFSTIINFSGELITLALEQGLKLEHAAAEQLKIKNGLAYDAHNPKYLPIVSALAENLIDELKKALEFYREHFANSNPITHITLCGGMANWKNIDEFIVRKLKIEAKPGHPWKNLRNPALYEFEPTQSILFASAIGLALRAAQNPFMSVC